MYSLPPPPLTHGMDVVKIATININGITAQTRVGMLINFIRRHDFDILFVQEVTSLEVLNIKGYVTHLNIRTSMRGTAILARTELHLTNITTLPSGCAIAAEYSGIRLINVYAPSGTAWRTERERFFNSELPDLFHTVSQHTLIGGDFNCILHPADTTGPFQTSQALTEIVRGLALTDTWNQDPLRPTCTHHSHWSYQN